MIEDVIGPEALKSVQRSVQDQELIRIDSADLFNGTHVLLTESLDDVTHIPAFVAELDAYRAAVYAAALVIEKSRRDQLLEIVGDIRAQIVASRAQFDAKACRKQAANCRKAAKKLKEPAHRIMLEHIDDTWTRIATDIIKNNQ